MAYRRRGGHNGMTIIRPQVPAPFTVPPRSPMTDDDMSGSDENNHQRQIESNSIEHEVEEENDEQEAENEQEANTEFPDETGNPMANRILHKSEGLWFHSREVVDEVVEASYKTYFMGPWYNWSKVPQEARGLWWKAFKTKFSWDPLMAKMVKKGWQQKCRRRLSNVVCKMFKTKNYRAKWCHPSIRKRIAALRTRDEFKKKSAQCSLNRKNPDKDVPIHCQGSKSTEQIRVDLEKSLKRVPTAAEVYYKGHVNHNSEFVDKTAENVWTDFQNKLCANLEAENPRKEDELLLEALGGWKNGRIYGLGSATENLYVKPHKDPSTKKVRDELVTNLQDKVVHLTAENLQQKKELEETKAGLLEANTKLDETTIAMKTIQEQVLFLSQNAILR